MKTLLFICFVTLFSFTTMAQSVSCEKLMKYVKENGTKKGSIDALQLLNSTWLKEVTAYSIDGSIVVIAEIKKDEYGISTKKYIFCGIPNLNWEYFYWGNADYGKTYGERFHKYIIDYQCNCQ